MGVIVDKAFKYRFFPTNEQAEQLARTFGCDRYVYNQALELRYNSWQQEKKSIGYNESAAKLTEWKKEPERAFLCEVSSLSFNNRFGISTRLLRISSRNGPNIRDSNLAIIISRPAMPPMPSRLETGKSHWPSNRRRSILRGAAHCLTL